MVGVAVIFEEEGGVGTLDAGCDAPGCGAGADAGVGSGRAGEARRRFWTGWMDGEGPVSMGIRVASTGELGGSVEADGWTWGLGEGGGMDGRIGFGLWTGGVNCYTYLISPTWRV